MKTPEVRIILFVLAASVLLLIVSLILQSRRKKQEKIEGLTFNQKMSDMTGKFCYRLDKILTQNRLTEKYYIRMRRRVELITPADEYTISKIAAKNTLISFFLAIISVTIMLAFGELDIFYIMICVFVTYIMFTYTLSSKLEKQDTNLLEQFTNFLSEIRHYYYETSTVDKDGSIEEAVYSSIDHVPYEMGLHATKIHEILESDNVDYEVQKYNETAPNHFIMTFVASCASIIKFGDKRLGSDRQSVFLKGVNYLKQEVNQELLKRKKMQRLFSGLVWMSIIPLFTVKFLERMLSNNNQDMADYFHSSAGTISLVVIFLVSVVSYSMIIKLKDTENKRTKEHLVLKKLGEVPFIQSFLTDRINKNYTKALKTNDLLKAVGEKMGPNLFLLQRIIYSVLAFLLSTIVFFTINYNQKSELLENFTYEYETSIISNNSYREEMRNISSDLIHKYKNSNVVTEDLLSLEITSSTRIANKTYADMVAETVMARIHEYHNITYQWWYVAISTVIALIASYVPVLFLHYRKKIMMMSMEDEVVQFQTIILMLMHIDRMSVDIILEWMERFANIFKEDISECILNLESGERKALKKLRDDSGFEPFTRLVDNLITVDKVNVANAFDEIETERGYYLEKRKDDNEATVVKKYMYGKACGFAPLIAEGILYILLPFAQVAVGSYLSYSNYINM